jgi:molybdate transport system ATP-binding protein
MSAAMEGPFLTLRFTLPREAFDIHIDARLDLSETIALYGPSGSGKTSVLRIVAGLERAAKGTVSFENQQWQTDEHFTPAHRRLVGYVFQDAVLFPHLDVRDNLSLARRVSGRAGRFSEPEIVDALDIGHLLDRDTTTLSGGETQRVAIARTLLSQPQLLLMDEPVSSLDADSRRETIEYIARLTQAYRLPLIYVTHDTAEVARLAATTLLLEAGRVQALGRTRDVFAQMKTATAGGETATVLEARVCGATAGLTALDVAGQTLRIPMGAKTNGERVQLRILARDVVIAKRKIEDTSIRNILAGRIQSIVDLDPGTVEILVRIADQTLKAHITKIACDALALHDDAPVYAMIKSVALGNMAWDSNQ